MHFAAYNSDRTIPTRHNIRDLVYSPEQSSTSDLYGSYRLVQSDQLDTGHDKLPLFADLSHEGASSLPSHHRCSNGCQRVVINVSGLRFETQIKTLNRLPNTLLGNPSKRRQFWDSRRNEFFLDRHRPTFQSVLYFYQSGGRLKLPPEVPADVFLNELEFYELGSEVIDAVKRNLGYIIEKKLPLPDSKWKRIFWVAFEEPSSSWLATAVTFVSVATILASLVSFCLETLPEYRNKTCLRTSKDEVVKVYKTPETIDRNMWPVNLSKYQSSTEGYSLVLSHGSEGYGGSEEWLSQNIPPNYKDPFFIVEAICVTWFTVEFLLRFIVCPSKRQFLKTPVNIVDLLAIMPFFVTLVTGATSGSCVTTSKSSFLLTLRVIRVVRVFKLTKHSQGLQILAKTLTSSCRELSLFVIFLVLAILVFSAAMYFAEHDENPAYFPSIPHSFWYTIVTMTTVGYGDTVPIGTAGKVIGSFCVLAGVLVIALPVPIIVTNFSNYYVHATGRGIAFAVK